MTLRRVVLESPYANGVDRNVEYARACMRDCLSKGEAPIASHLLYTQDGILDDCIPEERKLGIAAGHAWIPSADAVVVYIDYGISHGMMQGIAVAALHGVAVERRRLNTSEVLAPGHTDLMVTPESIDACLELNPLPEEP